MSTFFIHWITDSPHGFSLNITGLLSATGDIWSGLTPSPSGNWKLTLDSGSKVTQTVNPPHYNYDLHMSNMLAVQAAGPSKNFDIFTAGFGLSSWPGQVPQTTPPPFLPRSSGWQFTFESKPGGAPVPPGWKGTYTVTLLRALVPADFTTWLYTIDIEVNCP